MSIKSKIAVIGVAGIPATYGGFETLAEHLTRLLNKRFDFTVYCSSKNYERKQVSHNNSRLIYLPLGSNGKQSIVYDFVSMLHALRYADAMLILGVSGCLFLPLIRLLFRGKMIVNIDGLEWKRDKWRWYAKWYLRVSEAFAVWFSDEVIADHPIIQDYVKKKYGKEAHYVAYGADHVVKRVLSEEIVRKYPFLKEPYALSVCRIEPENNVHMIMDAMTRPGMMNFVIIGNWDGNQYARDLKAQCLRYHNVHMIDPIYDQIILDQFRSNCAVYIHGHSAGGTNPSLIEAMQLGCLILSHHADYNRIVVGNCVACFSSAQEIFNFFRYGHARLFQNIGIEMGATEENKYLWNIVAQNYKDLLER